MGRHIEDETSLTALRIGVLLWVTALQCCSEEGYSRQWLPPNEQQGL